MENAETIWVQPGKRNLKDENPQSEASGEQMGAAGKVEQEAQHMPSPAPGGVVKEPVPDEGAVQPVVVRPEPEKVLLSWRSPSRPFKMRNREFWVTIFVMGGILGLILFVIEGWMPVAVIVALVFLIYVMSTVPPEMVDHKITNKGVVFGERTYVWANLTRFWFEEQWGQKKVLIDALVLPGRLQMLLGDATEEDLRTVLKTYLIEEKPKDVWMDKAVKWVNKKVPIES